MSNNFYTPKNISTTQEEANLINLTMLTSYSTILTGNQHAGGTKITTNNPTFYPMPPMCGGGGVSVANNPSLRYYAGRVTLISVGLLLESGANADQLSPRKEGEW